MTRALLEACRQAMQFSQGVFPPTAWTHLIAAIDAELAKPEQQARRPMTADDIYQLAQRGAVNDGLTAIVRAVEAFHGIKETP